MRYRTVRYVQVAERYLELYSHDGTCRDVVFRDDAAVLSALVEGRAEIDIAAIERGFLPSGSYLVSRAGDGLTQRLPIQLDIEDPLAIVRQRFSVSLLVRRSEYVTEALDAAAHLRDPLRANGYDATVASMAKRAGQR